MELRQHLVAHAPVCVHKFFNKFTVALCLVAKRKLSMLFAKHQLLGKDVRIGKLLHLRLHEHSSSGLSL